VIEAKGCVIEDNVLIDTFFGIYLFQGQRMRWCATPAAGIGQDRGVVRECHFTLELGHLMIEDNDIAGHRDGIYFEFTTAATVRRNRSRSNLALRPALHVLERLRVQRQCVRGQWCGACAVMYSKDVSYARQSLRAQLGAGRFGLLLKEISDSRIEAESALREQRRPQRRRNQTDSPWPITISIVMDGRSW
jgi:nitrous oxidase accessory protein